MILADPIDEIDAHRRTSFDCRLLADLALPTLLHATDQSGGAADINRNTMFDTPLAGVVRLRHTVVSTDRD